MPTLPDYLTNISIISYLIVFAAGVAASFTPCVYPLIPIVVGVIGSSREKSRTRNFILSLSYVLGLALTFSILGLISALTGRLIGQFQASPLAGIIVGGIIILFGLVLLDKISLPTFLLHRAGVGKIKRDGSISAVFFMGMVSGFLAAPCTVAILGALLTYVATTQNTVFGFSLLFTFGLGLGTLLILIGTFVGILQSLPKLEKKMQMIQKAMAWVLIIWGGYLILKAGAFR